MTDRSRHPRDPASPRDVAPGITGWGKALRVRRGAAAALALVLLGACIGVAGCGSGGAGSVASGLTGTRTEGITAPSSSTSTTSPVTPPARTETTPSQTVAGAASGSTTVSTPRDDRHHDGPGTDDDGDRTGHDGHGAAQHGDRSSPDGHGRPDRARSPPRRRPHRAEPLRRPREPPPERRPQPPIHSPRIRRELPGWVWGLIGACVGGARRAGRLRSWPTGGSP